ncbi:MAG: exodeoxyribonuclease VII small subunit [Anaerolineaceae bacterium]|jgi:exodeoxyribonuclease VII small subunit|nr:exodeoxyribonuclease VII small subunit [Anaerolineaceae bacterium]MDI9531952.1 exodeoxyribonuclease VII small subunit [Chloroflexota bacterium]HNZ15911.1 exodeoxyribonuclease VII small subunit [Anaerolineaceae bacterium]HOT52933.1 exodeoxyribonuclease VII small subunit [Anaerolineaceae bacterium]
MKDQATPSFETAFASLQQIITQLENSELPLEEALKLYEEGKRLSDLCGKLLENAQLRVETLSPDAADGEAE